MDSFCAVASDPWATIPPTTYTASRARRYRRARAGLSSTSRICSRRRPRRRLSSYPCSCWSWWWRSYARTTLTAFTGLRTLLRQSFIPSRKKKRKKEWIFVLHLIYNILHKYIIHLSDEILSLSFIIPLYCLFFSFCAKELHLTKFVKGQ